MNVESVERERERRLTNWLCSARWKKVFDTDLLPSNAPGTTYCALTHRLCHCFTQLNMSGLEFCFYGRRSIDQNWPKNLYSEFETHTAELGNQEKIWWPHRMWCVLQWLLCLVISQYFIYVLYPSRILGGLFFFCSWQNFAIHLLQLVIFFRIAKGLRSDWVMLEPTLDSWSHHLRSARTQYLRLVMSVQLTQFSICMF